MAAFFRDQNAVVVKATGPFTWLWQLLFSPLHFAYHGIWGQAAISLAAMIFTFGLSFIVYAFIGKGIIQNHYRTSGWKEVPSDLLDKARAQYAAKATLTEDDLRQ